MLLFLKSKNERCNKLSDENVVTEIAIHFFAHYFLFLPVVDPSQVFGLHCLGLCQTKNHKIRISLGQ